MAVAESPYTLKQPSKEEVIPFNGANFHTSFWAVPEGVPVKGRIVYVHGFSEYSGCYVKINDALSTAGYEVFFFDQRGAGRTSPGKLRAITNEFHVFNDLDFFIEKNLKEIADSEKHACKKVILCGHSMGGAIILNYGVKGKFKDQIRCLAATGPFIELHPKTQPGALTIWFATLAMWFLPDLRINTKLNQDYVTADPEWLKFLKNDPFVNPLVGSLKQINDCLERGTRLLKGSFNKDFSVPVLIVHGEDDSVNDRRASEKFIDSIKIEDKLLVEPKGGKHSLFIDTEEIFQESKQAFLDWFEKH